MLQKLQFRLNLVIIQLVKNYQYQLLLQIQQNRQNIFVFFVYQQMQTPPLSPQPPSYPMTYMQGSPLNNLGYSYPQSFPPSYSGFAGQGFPTQGYGYGAKPYSGGYLQPPHFSTTGVKSVEDLNRGISDPIVVATQQKAISSLTNQQGLAYQTSSKQIGIQHGYSHIQYIPYESYYIDYEQRQFVQNVTVPVERTVRDYYAVEHVIDYVPKQIEQTIVEMVPEQRTSNKLYYVPIQTQVIHMPQGDNANHAGKKTTVISNQTVQERERIISRPVPQTNNATISKEVIQQQIIKNTNVQPIINPPPTINQQTIISQQTQQIHPSQVIKSVQPVQIPFQPQPQPQQIITSGSQAARGKIISTGSQAARTPIQSIQGLPNPQSQTQIIQRPPPNVPQQFVQEQRFQNNFVSQSPPKLTQLPAQLPGQFIQNQQALRANQVQFQKKMSIPNDAKVNYQYSTRTVRNLSPQQLKAYGYQPRPAANSPGKAVQNQPQLGTQIIRPQPVVTQAETTSPQTLNPTLMKNKQVDLADSEHIDITKSTFHAFYGTSNQVQHQQQSLAQGQLTGTNPAVFTSANTNNANSAAFSFGDQGNTNVNRSSGTFAPIPEGQPNRISNGSVYDYDQYRGDY